MAEDTDPVEGEAGTPLGFAQFKAKSLKLTPLEVLICLEELSAPDQNMVIETLKQRRELPKKVMQIEKEARALKAKHDELHAHDKASLSRLEQHHPDSANAPNNARPQGSYMGQVLSSLHAADAMKYAMAAGIDKSWFEPVDQITQESLKSHIEQAIMEQDRIRNMEAMQKLQVSEKAREELEEMVDYAKRTAAP